MMKWLRRAYKGVSWQNPVINFGFKIIDIPDAIVRAGRGTSALPRYSIRVRSRGVANQFGGRLFHEQGEFMLSLLQEHTGLSKSSDILEIGCGCGCAAIAIARILENGSYRGMDIDSRSIESCVRNSAFSGKPFAFDCMDIYSAQYNPGGTVKASSFAFPYDDASVDIVFLTSVFTHMLPEDIANYVAEIGRILKPGGRLLTTVFLMDYGTDGASISFPYDYGDCRLHQQTVPERAVGYFYSLIRNLCERESLDEAEPPVLGNWRTCAADGEDPELRFGQDILVFEKGLL